MSNTTRFENLLEAVPDALVGMDQKGMIRFVNSQTESLFRYDRDDLVGQHIETLLPEPLWQIYASHRDDYFVDPRTRSTGLDLELIGRHHDGTTFPVNISMSHIDTGHVLLVITAVHDVASRKRAVRAAGLIAAIVEYSDDAIIASTLEGVVTSWNPAAERLYGYSGQEIVGRSAGLLAPEDRVGEVFANLAMVKDGRHVEHFETVRVRKDGSQVPVSLTVAPIHDVEGVIVGASAIHRDVTVKRRAFELAQRMAAIVESSEDAIFGRTLDGVVTYWNPAAERMFGYSGEEIIGQSVALMIPQDRQAEMEAILADVRAGKHVERLETIRVKKDGTMFPVSITVSPIHDEQGALVGASVIARDVTEQRRAFEVAQRMVAIVESSDDAIIGRTLEGTITSWNPAAERLYGYTSGEIIGTSFDRLVPQDRMAEICEAVARIGAGRCVDRLETFLVRKDGSLVPISSTLSPIRGEDGTIVGISALHRDVSEQRRAFEIAQRMEAIIESSDDGIVGQSLTGIIESWNPAAERVYGYTSEEIIGRSIGLLMPEDRRHEMDANLARIRAGQPVERVETVRVRKDGTRFPISLTVSPIRGPDGVIVGASGIGRDMTEQEHAAQYARSLIEADLDPLVTISPAGRINDVNEATVKITGVPREALIGSDYAQYVTEPDKGREFFQQVFEQGSATGYRLTVRHRDGRVTDVVCNASVYRDLNGDVLGVLATGHDVTIQKKAFETAQRMAAIIEHSTEAIISGSLEGSVTSWNPAAEKMYGYTSQEIVGRPAELLSPKDRAGEIRAVVDQIRAGQNVENLESVRVRKDGTVFPVSITVSPIRDTDGVIVGTSVIHRDETELKHAARYARSLIEAALDPMATISPDGKITDVNHATENITGVAREQLIGTDFSQYFTDSDMARDAYARAFAQGSLTDYPLVLVHQNGTLVDVLYNASVYRDFNGVVLGVLAVARDASKLRQEERLSQQLQVALTSRVVIEQAKGITAQQHGITIDKAYQLIRAHARNNNTSLRRVAEAIVAVGLQV